MIDPTERGRLADYAPSGPARLDIVSEYLRTFLALDDESGLGHPTWMLALTHADCGGVHVVADQYAPGRTRNLPKKVATYEHTFPAECFEDHDGLAIEACKMLPEEFVVQRWAVRAEVHTAPTTRAEAERIKTKVEVHAGKVRGVEFVVMDVGTGTR
jgi:hypothetical protein